MRIQSTATKTMVNAIRRTFLTSLLEKGEVCQGNWKREGLGMVAILAGMSVVGGSRLERGDTCKSRRSVKIGRAFMALGVRRTRLTEVRATIVAKKWGNSHGAKGGRKANQLKP